MPLRTSMRFQMNGWETRLSSNRLVAQSGGLGTSEKLEISKDPRLQNFKRQFVWKDKKILVIFHEVNLSCLSTKGHGGR